MTVFVSIAEAVVVVARVERLDARVALQRQATDYIRGRFVSAPGRPLSADFRECI